MSEVTSFLPPEVERAYFDDRIDQARLLGVGIINTTVLIIPVDGVPAVVQKLSPIFDETLMGDYGVVSGHLRDDGWTIPSLLPTDDGSVYKKDTEGKVWRAFEFIESDEDVVGDSEKLTEYGSILGRLHTSLRTLDYEPVFALPHFHDTHYYATHLSEVSADIPSLEGRGFAEKALQAYAELPQLPDYGKQLIHGDPRIANILHKDGRPYTFIDWDTLMNGTVWMDLGDMLRSIAQESLAKTGSFDVAELSAVAEAYRREAFPNIQSKEFEDHALLAGQTIALELAMRFTADFAEGDDGYFAWDSQTFSSRHEHNMSRAAKQWKIITDIDTYRQNKLASEQ